MSPEANDNQVTKPKFDTSEHPEGGRPFNDGSTLPDVARLNPDGTLETDLVVEHADVSKIDPNTHDVDFDKVPLLDTAPAPSTETLPANKSKKGLLIGIGSAAAGVGLTAAAFLGLSGGDKADAPRPIDATSAPAAPSPEAPTPTEAFDLFENNMLYPEGTAREVLGNYATIVSNVINARVEAGVPVADDTDLQYLINSNASPEDVAAFKSFVQSMAGNVVEARQLREEHGLDNDIRLNVYSNFVSSTPTADGGFVIEAQDEYWAIDKDDQQVGEIIANLDTHIYTFVRSDVLLPDGSLKNTLTLAKFENVQNTTTE